MSATKTKFPRAVAAEVAEELLAVLRPVCAPDRCVVAGSFRRGKAEVGDLEIVFVPQVDGPLRAEPGDLFAFKTVNLATDAIERLVQTGCLQQRLNKLNNPTWGPLNKLAVHVATGLPVDLFATIHDAWWNYLFCRTGSADTNRRIAARALDLGWRWHPFDRGFTDSRNRWVPVKSEEDVFTLLRLPYLPPESR